MVTDDLDDVLREHDELPATGRHVLALRGAEAWHLVCVERGTDAVDANRCAIDARRRRGPVPHARHRVPRRARAQPGAAARARRLDRRRRAAPWSRSCAGCTWPRPTGGPRDAPPCRAADARPRRPRLYGERVMLRPLVPGTSRPGARSDVRNDAWLTPWEPRRPLAEFDPTTNRNAFNSRVRRPRARRGQRALVRVRAVRHERDGRATASSAR